MTLPQVAFFPETILPLYIFEPRYQQMLSDVLADTVIFAVAGLDESLAGDKSNFEPSHRVATAGIVRACRKNPDGTSNLLLQGLSRIEIVKIVKEDTYRIIAVKPLASINDLSPERALELRRAATEKILRLGRRRTGNEEKLPELLAVAESPGVFIDIAVDTYCDDPNLRQKILQTLEIETRFSLYLDYLDLHLSLGSGDGSNGEFGKN